MCSIDYVEELLPFPFKIEICCDPEEFRNAVQNSFAELREKHNKKYDTEVEFIARHYIDVDAERLEFNEFEIYVGRELVHKGKGPDLFDTDPEKNENFYKSIVLITEGILDVWHDRIVEAQIENDIKVEQLKEEGNDEVLYAYYSRWSFDKRAFQYLKRLAARYPHSEYRNKLRRIYKSGRYGWHRKNMALALKMRNGREFPENF